VSDGFHCDVAIVGSGFGGAVSALRLAEKGYDVLVLEQGRRIEPEHIKRARTDLREHVWEPDLGLHGYFWQKVFRDVGIIGASGVGGGSIVWGAVLLEPPPRVFDDPAWGGGESDWEKAMAPHYAEAARMLGRVETPVAGLMDDHLKSVAESIGGADSFGPTPVAIHFGQEGVTEADPFFDGEGPERTGCRLCGGCLAGCPYGSKNSLDLNYLYLAEKSGARIESEMQVRSIAPLVGGGFELRAAHPWIGGVNYEPIRAERVVVAAGVLGTLELLFRCRDEFRTLPGLSPMLGRQVRTNSEAVTVVLDDDEDADLSRGPAISTDFHPDERTHITQNRYIGGGKLMRWQIGPLVDGTNPGRRAVETALGILRHPIRFLKAATARNFEQRLTAITVMQDVESEVAFELRRSPVRPWKKVLRSKSVPGREAPSYLPVANEAARRFAEASGGTPLNLLVESAGGRSVTAHILGGAVIGEGREQGVIDPTHEVHGHPGLFVADASAIPVNLGVNPSLTITAMAERFASLWPDKEMQKPGPRQYTGHRWTAEGLPKSPAALRRLWGALPAPDPEMLEGSHRAVFVGPTPARALAPAVLAMAGLPDWYGKRFRFEEGAAKDVLTGMNLLRNRDELVEHLEMRAAIEPSALDGAPVLVSTYPGAAPLPWRHVRDEFRLLAPGLLLGMAVFDQPLARRIGTPFALEQVDLAESIPVGRG
jgi:cholesterol oxidase